MEYVEERKPVIICEPGGQMIAARLLAFLEKQTVLYGDDKVELFEMAASRENGSMYARVGDLIITAEVHR